MKNINKEQVIHWSTHNLIYPLTIGILAGTAHLLVFHSLKRVIFKS